MQAGDKIGWSDLGGTTYRGVCIYVDADDPAFPWKVADDDGVAHWIGPQNEPFVIDAPTAWTTERPTEPGWYWFSDDADNGAVSCVEVHGPTFPAGGPVAFFAGNECEEQVRDMNGKWQRAEPKP
jgi:hypothetical protein